MAFDRNSYQRRYESDRRAYINDYKTRHGCMDCKMFYPGFMLDFDHVRGQKLFNIGNRVLRSKQALNAEVAKCDVVCKNCHALRTHKRKQK